MEATDTPALGHGEPYREEPKPDALAPEALREELINIVRKTGLPMTSAAAEIKVDAVLQKLAAYYAAVSVPEVQAPIHEQYAAVQRLQFTTDRILEAGAGMSGTFAEQDPLRTRWVRVAPEFREAVQQVLNLLA